MTVLLYVTLAGLKRVDFLVLGQTAAAPLGVSQKLEALNHETKANGEVQWYQPSSPDLLNASQILLLINRILLPSQE